MGGQWFTIYIIVSEIPMVVSELLPNGDLKTFLQVLIRANATYILFTDVVFCLFVLFLLQKNKRPGENLLSYMLDISMGMHYLAQKGLVHRVINYNKSVAFNFIAIFLEPCCRECCR